LAEELSWQALEADRLRETQPPANDPASVGFNDVGAQAFKAGSEHVRAEADYYLGLADALSKALGVYREADEQARGDVVASGGDDSDGRLI